MINTIYTCGIKINPMTVHEILAVTRDKDKSFQITGVNMEQIALLAKNTNFADYINSSDFVNIDGTFVYLYLKLRGFRVPQRTLCADLLYGFLNEAHLKNESIYLLGASQEVVEKVVSRIKEDYPGLRIAGYHNGYFDSESEIVEDIAKAAPDYLFIGMPSPMKERFASKYKSILNTRVCLGVGGMFDIIAGKANRAPVWIQKCGMEWFFRITQNPVGHTKRILNAFFPCISVFIKYLFEKRIQTFN